MKNLFSKLRYTPKRFAITAALMVASTTTALAFAWGPDRPTFTIENPAQYVTFNSITKNPNYGDEREFVIIRDLTTGSSYGDSTNLVPGHEYQVQVYIHNNAATRLNDSGVGVAKNTTVRAVLPTSVTGTDTVDSFIKASNAKPLEVWDTAELKSANKVDLEYVSGSAHLSTNYQQVDLPDTILSTGVKVGDKDLSGDWRGCLQYAGAVTFKFRVKQPATNSFTMDKQVRKHSTVSGGWVESYDAQPGEVVDYLIRYQNTGNTTQENVTVKDTLPAGMTYVSNSTVVANGNHPTGQTVADGITTTGINIGTYAPNASAWVRFSAKVAANDKLTACGPNTLHNVATVETGAGNKSDSADVTVTKTCEEDKDIVVCRLSDKVYPVTIKESAFDATKYSKNPEDCKVLTEKSLKVCELSTKKSITINEKDFDAAKHSTNFADCKETPVTEKTPETPATIASTGPETIVSGLFGSSALGLGISSFVRSRNALRSAMNR
ncbi:MAG: isopeptide-forming domain-containing fimbrial protein [Candidatus Saccharimonadales bacterium]